MVLGTYPMIKVGDIVYQKRRGGIIQGTSDVITSRLGLIIKEHREKGAIPQFYVQFNQENPKLYYQHDLEKIRFGKDKKSES